jgi:hypothetical protein
MHDGGIRFRRHSAVIAAMTPAQKSLKLLRERGGLVEKVEHWNAFARHRQDLFGFGDILHVDGDMVTIVQTTSMSNLGARLKKIRENQAAALWLESPHRSIEVHGWKKGTMEPRIVRLHSYNHIGNDV